MMSIAVWPYRLANPKYISFSPWEWNIGLGWKPTDVEIAGWDFDTTVGIRTTVTWDSLGLLGSASLPEGAELQVVVIVDCRQTGERIVSQLALSESDTQLEIELQIPAGAMAGEVTLEHHLVSSHPVREPSGELRFDAGARMLELSRKTIIRLAPLRTRFPTDAFSFSSVGLVAVEWIVSIESGDTDYWSLDFSEAVRLSVNTDLLISAAVLDPTHVQHDFAKCQLEREIVQTLFRHGVQAADELEPGEFLEGSIGAAMANLGRSLFSSTLQELLDCNRYDPETFDQMVKVAIPFPRQGARL
ncbi:hypothetical protein [Arthrobacter sp. AOP36-C1-22]|uniref:hypothetical protein n=1 Tax=Arthrobacter sp. AOP36-C1-22 TaxID=3457683 RepID=UPI004034A019